MNTLTYKKGLYIYITYIVVLYVFLHNPHMPYVPFVFGMIKLLYIPMLILLMMYNRELRAYFVSFQKERNLLFVIIAYVILRTIIGGDASLISVHIIGFFEIFLVPLFIVAFSYKIGLDSNEKFVRALLIVGAIGGIISLMTIVFPFIQDFINNTFGNLDQNAFLNRNKWRGRGLSEALTSDYAYIQASLVVLFCFFSKNTKWFIVFIPLMILSIIYNARTGIIILALGLLLFGFYERNPFKLVFYIIAGFFVYYIFNSIFNMLSDTEDVVAFITDFSEQLESVYVTQDIDNSRTANELFGKWLLPDNAEEWLVGRGFRFFGVTKGYSSDVGLLNYLNYGGVFYVGMIVCFYFVILKRLFRNTVKWYYIFFVITTIVITIKSIPFPNTGEMRFLMLVYYFFIISDKRQRLFNSQRLKTIQKNNL